MMRTKGPISLKGMVAVAALALAGAGVSAHAQNAGTYQLPPSPTPSASAQGPVVADAPPPRVAATPSAAPSPAPTPTVSVTPVAVPSPRPTARPSPSATATAATPRASAAVPVSAPPATIATPPPTETSPSTAPPLPSFIPDQSAPAEAQVQPDPAEDGVHPVVWLALAMALLTAGVAALALHRRRSQESEPAFAPPVLGKAPSAPPPPVAEPAPPTPKSAHAAALTLDLDAARMSASLVNATLAYRITLNAGADIEEIILRGDMTSAHASRPDEEQFGLNEAPILHRLARIEAGSTTELGGEIRLPLAMITPIRHGSAAMFVPLVRIEAAGMAADGPVRVRSAFVIGLDEQGAARLQPFRLDQGPRVYQQVGSRTLAVPAFG